MKALFIMVDLGTALLTTLCYLHSSKEYEASSNELQAPSAASSDRY